MDDDLLPIGELSRRSGLTVSALRFYDREGVLRPVEVDPVTGYRRYARGQVAQARTLAALRRVQMPLAEMEAVLAAGDDGETLTGLLQAHLARLEAGLVRARDEIARLTARWAPARSVRAQVPAGELTAALRAVRYAVSTDSARPALQHVLVEVRADEVVLVATDRFRLALARVGAARGAGPSSGAPPSGVLLDRGSVSALLARLAEEGEKETLVLEVHGGVLSVGLGGAGVDGAGGLVGLDGAGGLGGRWWQVEGPELDFPDYRALLDRPEGEALADLDGLRACALVAAPGEPVEVDADHHADGAFLLEALDGVGPGGTLRLPLDGEIGPLVLTDGAGSRLALVMPVRPEPS